MSLDSEHDWAIVLAAGEGTRLRALTTGRRGGAVPKQFCSLRGGESLLRSTIGRARRVVDSDRIVTVVARQHSGWWERDLAGIPRRNVIVQPQPRGTAPGLLLPLVSVLFRDPDAIVAVLPSDHFVADEDVLERTLEEAFSAARASNDVVMLGISPDGPETQYGWILPTRAAGVCRVASFVEKPRLARAVELQERGALWNSFLLVASGGAFQRLYEDTHPELLGSFLACLDRKGWAEGALEALYADLGPTDFSRDVLERVPDALRVLPVPPCGWADLGTPDRVARCLAGIGGAPGTGDGPRAPGPDLAQRVKLARAAESPETAVAR